MIIMIIYDTKDGRFHQCNYHKDSLLKSNMAKVDFQSKCNKLIAEFIEKLKSIKKGGIKP